MNYSCVKLQRLFVLEGVSWRAGQPHTVSGRRIFSSLTPDHNGSLLLPAEEQRMICFSLQDSWPIMLSPRALDLM